MYILEDVAALLSACDGDLPIHVIRPHAAFDAARDFNDRFPGHTWYAVKASPHAEILRAIWAAGVRRFDVASIGEIDLVLDLFPEAELAFMHPVKSRRAIRHAWDRGVRIFSLDHAAELEKIRATVDDPSELCLIVRLTVPDGDSGICLARKFGASGAEAAALLFAVRGAAGRVGVSFHVGSQAMRPEAWEVAMDEISQVIIEAGVLVDVVDVGGGFPVAYPDRNPPPLEKFFEAIERGFERMPITETCELWAEPGRSLCAASASVLTKVELRKGNTLYLNDGTYGGLFDAGMPRFVYPVRRHRPDGTVTDAPLMAVDLYGPTCDGIDHMPGPFHVPDDIVEGDWIEIGMLGAYSLTLRTAFNGVGHCEVAVLSDAAFTTQAQPVVRLAKREEAR